MAKVSVIIPTYNRAQFIAEAIQSVLDQTFTNFEIIVVDDGSTDNTRDVVGGFKDHRIKYIYQENQWAAIARNNGIKASEGEYLTFLDSDDILMENALLKGTQVLDEHPEVAFSYGQDYIMDEKGKLLSLDNKGHRHSWVRDGKEQIREFLINGHHIGVCATMVRRSCLLEVGLWDPTYRHGSVDFDFLVRLAKRYAVAYISEPLGKVRIHPESITRTRELSEYADAQSRIFESIFNDPEIGHLFSNLRPMAYSRLYLRFAAIACKIGTIKTSRSYLFKALKTHPTGFLKGLWLPWIIQLLKTWVPMSVKRSVRRAKRYLRPGP